MWYKFHHIHQIKFSQLNILPFHRLKNQEFNKLNPLFMSEEVLLEHFVRSQT